MAGTREFESPEIGPDGAPQNGAPRAASAKPMRRAWGAVTGWAGGAVREMSLPEEDLPNGPIEGFVASTPPWLISLVIHIGIVMGLGLIVLEAQPRHDRSIEVDISGLDANDAGDGLPVGEQLTDPTQTVSTQGHDDVSESATGAAAVAATPDATTAPMAGLPPVGISKDGMLPMAAVEGPAIGLALTGREPGMKQALLKAYGGTGKTEGAVSAGLKWLAAHQQKNGLWSLSGPYSDGSHGDNDAAATGLALIAFQGAGFTPHSDPKDPFTQVVRRGWNALIKKMDNDGKFFEEPITNNQQLYTQAICTIALCELFGMTDDYQYKEAAQKAVDYDMKIQAPEGGWRYEPMIDSDMSVTGWYVMALQSAKMAGLEVKSPVFGNIEKFLDSVAREGGSQYAYRVRDGATLSLSAEGLLCREYLGWKHDDPRLATGVDYISANPPDWNKRNVYYWYYATQVMHHYEGKPWQEWNEEMRKLLPEKQVKSGKERGSWDPDGDRWGRDGGRLYVTCLSLYIMEVYYRHLPLYQTGLLAK